MADTELRDLSALQLFVAQAQPLNNREPWAPHGPLSSLDKLLVWLVVKGLLKLTSKLCSPESRSFLGSEGQREVGKCVLHA